MTDPVSIRLGAPGSQPENGDIVVGSGREVSGWQQISITLRCDGFPPQFSLSASASAPDANVRTPAVAGDLCWVSIGDDRVITGYLDEVTETADANSHSLTLSGRGKTQDLVDCSAEWESGQQLNGTALSIAERLAEPYLIAVELAQGASAGPQVPQWALDYGETGAAIVQRVAQNAGLLAYEDAAGRLLLADLGTEYAGGGAWYGEGGNVESYRIALSAHERFSQVVCASQAAASLNEIPGSDFFHTEADPNVRRHRQLDIVIAQVAEPAQEFTKRRARWEVTRRLGRSTAVEVTVDSWRDASGKLWAPNTLVPVNLPNPQVPSPLVLASVTFRHDASGTRADLSLVPREALALEPISLNPANIADVVGPDGLR